MDGKGLLTFAAILTGILVIPMFASANAGIALSSPDIELLTVTKFPYYYENQFRVYNTGDEEGFFTLEVKAESPDVEEWVTYDLDTFALGPEESTDVLFFIDVYDAYSGDYQIEIIAKTLPVDLETVFDGIGANGFISLAQSFIIDITVPDGNLYERPDVTDTTTPEIPEEVEDVAEEIVANDEGVVVKDVGRPISLDIPSKAVEGEEVELSASFIGGGEPFGMGLTLVSPFGESYELSRTAIFTFDEVGTWSVMVVIDDEVIVGKSVKVEAGKSTGVEAVNLAGNSAGSAPGSSASSLPIPLAVPVGALLLAVPLMRRSMRR